MHLIYVKSAKTSLRLTNIIFIHLMFSLIFTITSNLEYSVGHDLVLIADTKRGNRKPELILINACSTHTGILLELRNCGGLHDPFLVIKT